MALSSGSSGCSNPGGPSRYALGKGFASGTTRAVIQPDRTVIAAGERRLGGSVGWLLDRGFM
jgi:hypothetical protein